VLGQKKTIGRRGGRDRDHSSAFEGAHAGGVYCHNRCDGVPNVCCRGDYRSGGRLLVPS
jgi:hypothetical protein